MAQVKKFGAFSGVFTPSILTILGVIMYLRLPSIVGQAGLWMAVGIVLVAHVISISTGLSVSSIATDKKVKAGGTYYMISRSLGLPIGGTLGLALFIGLSFSVSLYVIGFSESFLSFWGWTISKNAIRLTGSIMLLVVTIVTLISTSLAIKTQFFIMTAIVLSLLSIFFGRHDFAPDAPLLQSLPEAAPFIVLFGIFFPAVTGFEAGVSMSGDLKDPKKGIPSGTIWAIAVGLFVYIGLVFFFSLTVSAEQLAGNPNVLLDISLFAPIVVAGIWGATISSALGSILGAPRILQATAVDRITPRFFAKGYGKENEPRHALILTFLIAEAGILIGELDVIARIVSMFFITTYGFLNLSCAIESWASPDFRPDFKIPKLVSIIGSVACFIVMIQLDLVAMIGASVLLGALYVYLKRRELTLESGDTWEGVWSSLVRTGLHYLSRSDIHERNWRPNIILFSGGTQARPHLIEFGRRLVKKRGLLSNFDLIENPSASRLLPKITQAVKEQQGEETGIFTRRFESSNIYAAMETIATFYGFSGIDPNTVLLGWGRNSAQPARFATLVHTFIGLDLNVMLIDYDKELGFGTRTRLDVWWRGAGNNISFALALIGFLMTSDAWRDVTVRFLIVNDRDTARTDTLYERMYSLLEAHRIEASVKVINNVIERKPIQEIVRLESIRADLTILGIPDFNIEDAEYYVSQVNTIIDTLGTVLLIRASSFFQVLTLAREIIPLPATQGDGESIEVAPLHAIKMPEAELLRVSITRFYENLNTFNDECVERLLRGLYQQFETLTDDIGDYIDRSLTTLKRSFIKDQRMRGLRELQRARSGLLFQSQRILSTFQDEKLPLLTETIVSGLLAQRAGLRDLTRKTPEILTIVPAPTLFASSRRDNAALRLWKLGKRIVSKVTSRPAAYDLWFRRLVEKHLMDRYQDLLLDAFGVYVRAGYETTWDVQKLLRDIVDGLARIENALSEARDVETLLDIEINKVQATLLKITENLQKKRDRAYDELQRNTIAHVQALADEAGHPTFSYVSKMRKSLPSDAAGILAELPSLWAGNQELLLNRARMDLALLSFQHRLSTIVQRSRVDLRQYIQHNVLDRYADLLGDMRDLAEAVNSDAESKLEVPGFQLQSFDDKAFIGQLLQDRSSATQDVPVTVRTMHEASFQSLTEKPFEEVVPVSVSLRRIVDYLTEIEFIGPLQEEMTRLPSLFERADAVAQDVLHLTTFRLNDPDREYDHVSYREQVGLVLNHGIDRLTEEYEQLLSTINELDPFIETRLQVAIEQLNAYNVTRSDGDLQRYVRGHKSREVLSRFKSARARLRALLSNRLVRLLYQRSEGLLYARRLQDIHATGSASADEGLSLLEASAPREEVLKNLPFFYRQLFVGTPTLSKDLWVGWEEEKTQAKRALVRYRQGFKGGLLVVGEPFSGKTSLSHLIASTHFEEEHIYHLNPPRGGSIEVSELEDRMQDTLGLTGSADECFGRLAHGSVIVLNSVDQWWERSENGCAVIDEMMKWIDRFSDRCFFILNINTFPYRFIKKIRDLEDLFLGIISCAPSNAEELKQIILLRHRSTGLKFDLKGKPEELLSEWEIARLFTAFFDYTRGNVGVALYAWISNITKATRESVFIKKPETPRVDILDRLKLIQMTLLLQFVLHATLTMDRLLRITNLPQPNLQREVNALKRSGLVIEHSDGVLEMNAFLAPHLIQALSDRRMLP